MAAEHGAADMTDRERRRFERQFQLLARIAPVLAPVVVAAQRRPLILVRLPLALLLIAGGLLAFLPILGLWMLPLGLLLLAVDLPVLRGPVSAAVIRGRRWLALRRRQWRRRLRRVRRWWRR